MNTTRETNMTSTHEDLTRHELGCPYCQHTATWTFDKAKSRATCGHCRRGYHFKSLQRLFARSEHPQALRWQKVLAVECN